MDFISGLSGYLLPFLLVLGVLVFVHEWGHYWVARRCGVKIEVFSIGFGPEIFGWTDAAQTRWKVSAVPLGGYVKMFGDADAASRPAGDTGALTVGERAVSFHHKPLAQRAAVVAAGPAANFLFSIIALAFLFIFAGHPMPPAQVGSVQEGSPAALAGLEAGDRLLAIDGNDINRFSDVAVAITGGDGAPVDLTIRRDGTVMTLTVDPEMAMVEARDGGQIEVPRIGVAADAGPYGIVKGTWLAARETVALSWLTLEAVGEIIVGERGTEELGGPLRIAQMSGDVAQVGVVALIWFMAILSINLGLINLFPVPMLDGGHLMFYAIEAVRGKPLGERAQEYGFRIGLALVLTLMVFATWNDLVQLQVVSFIRNAIS